jgi:hypothetical protein
MARLGMDVDTVEAVGRRLQRQGDYLANVARTIDALVGQAGSLWDGNVGRRFVDEWRSHHRGVLLNAGHAVRGLGTSALNNAAEQRRASGQGSSGSAGLARSASASGGSEPAWMRSVPSPPDLLLTLGAELAAYGIRLNGFKIVPADISQWELRIRHNLPDHWSSLPGQEAPSRIFHSLNEGFTAAGALLTFGTSALDQVHRDLADPNFQSTGDVTGDTGLLVSRAAVVGGTAALGALGGAAAGAAIGSIVPGPGTVVGAAVGGVIGGVAGSELGVWAGHEIIGATTATGNALSGLIYDGATEVGNVLGDAGDTVGKLVNPMTWWGGK